MGDMEARIHLRVFVTPMALVIPIPINQFTSCLPDEPEAACPCVRAPSPRPRQRRFDARGDTRPSLAGKRPPPTTCAAHGWCCAACPWRGPPPHQGRGAARVLPAAGVLSG